MHDPDLDGFVEFDDSFVIDIPAEKEPPPPKKPPILARLMDRIPGWPISRLAQAVFAEAFREAIMAGLPVDRSILLAAEVVPSPRFRVALKQSAAHVRAGEPIASALIKDGLNVHDGLLAALRVGEEHGCLARELGSFARRIGRLTPAVYHRAIGRSPESIEFAAALGRLLADQRLTVKAIRAAGDVASAGNPKFTKVVADVARQMEDSGSLFHALDQHQAYFDGLYREFLKSAASREEMRACLERLGSTH